MKRQSKGSAISFQWLSKACRVRARSARLAKSFGSSSLRWGDREVDLDLVEPAGVHGQVDEYEVGPALLEPPDGLAAAVGGAVVDDPEDAARGGVRLLGHHLPDQPVEGGDPASCFRAAEDPRPASAAAADVERGQVGERPLRS